MDLAKLKAEYLAAPESRLFAALADAYRRMGQLLEALHLLERGTAEHPDYISALVLLAQCQHELGREAEAEASFARVLQLEPDNLVALKQSAARAMDRGNYGQAQLALERVLEQDPYDAEALALRAALERHGIPARDEPAAAAWGVVRDTPAGRRASTPPAPEALEPELDLRRVSPPPGRGAPETPRLEPSGETPAQAPAPQSVPSPDWQVERDDDRIVVRQGPGSTAAPAAGPRTTGEPAGAPRGTDDFSTLTLARIYESQGYLDKALAIYDELHRKHPGNADVAERLRALQRRLAGVEPAASWRLLEPGALEAAPEKTARQLHDLTAEVRERDESRRHTRIGAPPGSGADPNAAVRVPPGPASEEEPDFERFLRYVRSLKR